LSFKKSAKTSADWIYGIPRKNVKIYIKINIKSDPTCFGLNNQLTILLIITLAKHNSTLCDDGCLNRNM